jgi:subtilisin family serine protease
VAIRYRPDVILATASPLARADDTERLNQVLEAEGLGRPLGSPKARTAKHVVIPTALDPALVRRALKRLRVPGTDVDRFDLDYQHEPGTVGVSARLANFDYYLAAGCKTGHGAAAWLAAPEHEMPPRPEWRRPEGGRRPVVALLDEGVEEHRWLPPSHGDDPFVTSPWQPSEPLADPGDGAYRGHGTFNAGIVRVTAPQARILSMRVMGDDGRVDESKLVEALTWLAGYAAQGNPLDVVCLPFGRHSESDSDGEGDEALETVRQALRGLKGVPVVASAGNDGTEKPVYPAAFANDADLSVVSVASSESATERAPYSNFGVWVRQWRGGTNMLSVMTMPRNREPDPKDGFAWWTGTSFAAVRYAGELAARLSIP